MRFGILLQLLFLCVRQVFSFLVIIRLVWRAFVFLSLNFSIYYDHKKKDLHIFWVFGTRGTILHFIAFECFLNMLLSGAEALGKDAFFNSLLLPVPSFAEGRHHLFIHMLSLTSPHVQTERAGCKRDTAKSVQFYNVSKGRTNCHKMTDVATESGQWCFCWNGSRGCKSTQVTIHTLTTSIFHNEVG